MPFFIKIAQFAAALSIFATIIVCLVNLVMTRRGGRVWALLAAALVAELLVIFRDIIDVWVGFGPFADVFAKFDFMSVLFTFFFAVAAHQFISYKRDELMRSFSASQTIKMVLESSLGAMGDGFDVVASDFRIIYSNPVMEQTFGSVAQLDTQSTGGEPNIGTQLVTATFRSGVPARGEEVITNGDGSRRIVDIVASPIASGDGQSLACVRVARDITEMKEMQRAIHEANLRLEENVRERTSRLEETLTELGQTHEQLLQSEKLAALGKIAAGLTHNIANPLSVLGPKLKLFGDYFWHVDRILRLYRDLHNVKSPDEIEKALDVIAVKAREGRGIDYYLRKLNRFVVPCVKEVHKIEGIVQDLVNYSRFQKPEVEPVDLNAQIRLVLSFLEYDFRTHDIAVEREFNLALPSVECYAAEINQVLTNLLINSIEALVARKKREPDFAAAIIIRTAAVGERVRIEIEDNGVGVDQENESKVFDPFFTTKPVGGSVGLGLSVSAGIIERHGGSVRLDSEKNQFSKFTIELPIKLQEDVSEFQKH
ncbi:PAS domain S-box protein [bacterium]|nr:PAS domain S-box protein [bacterium]